MQSRLVHGDCFDVLPTLDSGLAHTVIVDPPYNMGFDYGDGRGQDLLDDGEYLQRMRRLVGECVRLLAPTGGIWFLCPERWADEIGAILAGSLPRRNRIIWRETFGQYRQDRFPSGHRHLFWHVVDTKRSTFNADEIRVPSQRMEAGDNRASGPRVPDDVWSIPRLVGNARERQPLHPCQLPEALIERIVRCSSSQGDVILDPMAGSGTTLRVSQRLGRRYIGIERQEHFVDLIRRRLRRPCQRELFAD